MPIQPNSGALASPFVDESPTTSEMFPADMVEHLAKSAASAAAKKNGVSASSFSLTPQDFSWKDGIDLARELWNKAKSYKDLLDYGLYSQILKSDFTAHHAPYDVMRYVYDAHGHEILPSPQTLARREGGAVAGAPAANNAYTYSGYIFDFFKRRLGFVLPQPMMQVVNYNDDPTSTGMDNAFFKPMTMGLAMMVYGSGDGRYFKSFDKDITVVAHELAHDFIHTHFPNKFTFNGEHVGQPGSIDEHIADVIAKCVQAEYNGWNDLVEDWFIGADVMINPRFSIRDMAMPGDAYDDPGLGKDPQSDHMSRFDVSDKDHGGVHTNNGILNRLFTIFCETLGGAVYETPLHVWLRALELVNVSPTFKDFGQALLLAARQYHVEAAMQKAVKVVGILDYEVRDGSLVRTAP